MQIYNEKRCISHKVNFTMGRDGSLVMQIFIMGIDGCIIIQDCRETRVPLSVGDLDIVHSSFGPPEFTCQTASPSIQPLLQGSRSLQTVRPTDHATLSVAIGRI